MIGMQRGSFAISRHRDGARPLVRRPHLDLVKFAHDRLQKRSTEVFQVRWVKANRDIGSATCSIQEDEPLPRMADALCSSGNSDILAWGIFPWVLVPFLLADVDFNKASALANGLLAWHGHMPVRDVSLRLWRQATHKRWATRARQIVQPLCFAHSQQHRFRATSRRDALRASCSGFFFWGAIQN